MAGARDFDNRQTHIRTDPFGRVITTLAGVGGEAQLPASLGSKPAAQSISITPASDALFTLSPTGFRSQTVVTRPANVTPYTAGDVVGGVIAFANIGPVGGHVILTTCDLRIDISAVPAGMTSFRLHVYSATPPSALADNAVWDLPAGDRSAYIGFIDLGTPADLGSTLFSQVDSINRQSKLGASETALYGYLVTATGFTPASNSEAYAPCLRSVAL